jgi:hypothetical protein
MVTEEMKTQLLRHIPKDGKRQSKSKLSEALGWNHDQVEEVIDSLSRDHQIIRHRGRGGRVSLNMERQDSVWSLTLKYSLIAICFVLPSYASTLDIFWNILLFIAPFINVIFGLIIAISAEKVLMILYQKTSLRYGFLKSFQKNKSDSDSVSVNGNHLQTVFISLVNGRLKYMSNRFGIYKAVLPKWQLMSRVSCYIALLPPVFLFLMIGLFFTDQKFELTKESILLINYYSLLSSLLVLLIIHQWCNLNQRKASLLIYHPKKERNNYLLSYFFDYHKVNMLSREEVTTFLKSHDPEEKLYVNLNSRRAEVHGLYNQDTRVTFSTQLPLRDLFIP